MYLIDFMRSVEKNKNQTMPKPQPMPLKDQKGENKALTQRPYILYYDPEYLAQSETDMRMPRSCTMQ